MPHRQLLQKLTHLNVAPHIIAWISSYLCNHSQKVGVAGFNFIPCHVLSGVDRSLGPLLFLIYIDGLTGLQLEGGNLTMFADDLLLYKSIRSLQNHFDLQRDVDTLVQWLLDHNLTLNVKKCKSLLISRKKTRSLLNHPSILV